MTTINYTLDVGDAAIVAGIRNGMSALKGKYLGPDARGPFENQKLAVPAAPNVRMEPGSVAGVPGWWCRPLNARSEATLIYYHGGWYMLGTAESFCNQASHFAAGTRTNTFVPEYRRAPETVFPGAYDDAMAVCLELAKHCGEHIALVGDSVGGSLALIVLAAAASLGTAARLVGAVAMSPVTDLTLSGGSMQDRADADPIFSRDMVAQFVSAYLSGADPCDGRASPLFGDLKGLPPVRIDVGEDEILLDDAIRYAATAETARAEVTLGIWAGMPHTFQGMIGKLAAATKAIAAENEFLNHVLGPVRL